MFNKYTYNESTFAGADGSSSILASAAAFITIVVSSAVAWVARSGEAVVSQLVSASGFVGGIAPGASTVTASVTGSADTVIYRASSGVTTAAVTAAALAYRETNGAGALTCGVTGSATGIAQDNAAAPVDRQMIVPTDNRTMVVPA